LLSRTLGGFGPVVSYSHLGDSHRRARRHRTIARNRVALDAVGHCLVFNCDGSWVPFLLATGAVRVLGTWEVRD